MIQQIVARPDLRKHLAHLARCIVFGLGALGARAFRRSGNVNHGDSMAKGSDSSETVARNAARAAVRRGAHRRRTLPCRFVAPTQSECARRGPFCPIAWTRSASP